MGKGYIMGRYSDMEPDGKNALCDELLEIFSLYVKPYCEKHDVAVTHEGTEDGVTTVSASSQSGAVTSTGVGKATLDGRDEYDSDIGNLIATIRAVGNLYTEIKYSELPDHVRKYIEDCGMNYREANMGSFERFLRRKVRNIVGPKKPARPKERKVPIRVIRRWTSSIVQSAIAEGISVPELKLRLLKTFGPTVRDLSLAYSKVGTDPVNAMTDLVIDEVVGWVRESMYVEDVVDARKKN